MSSVTVRVSRRFDASAERVFDAWLDPATLGRWLYATQGGQMLRVDVDPRVGGAYAIVERRPDGDAAHYGRYLEIDRPLRLVLTLALDPQALGDRITVDIEPDGDGCRLTLTHEMAPEHAPYADRTERGWTTILASLARHLEHPFSNTRSPREGAAPMNDFGIATAPDTLRIERLLPGPIERVWAYLTESEKRGTWLARGEMDLRPGGAVELVFHNNRLTENDAAPPPKYAKYGGEIQSHGHVIECDPPRLLVFTWGEDNGSDSRVRVELTPRGDEVQLVLTHSRLASREGMVDVAGGWHTHLGILADRLAGRTPAGFWATLGPVNAEYEKRIPAM